MDIYQILRVRRDVNKDELQAKYLRMLDTYQLTATFAEDKEVAKIAQMKLEKLLAVGAEYGLYSEHPESEVATTPQTDISSIKLALNSSRADVSKLKGSNISGKIDKLPESAEKHFLKAVVNLRIDSSFQGCQKAVEELHKAIRLDPANEAYTGLLDAISEQIKDYEQRQRDKVMQDEKERQERERKSQEALAEAQRRQFWDAASPCIIGIVSIGVMALMCCCSCKCCESACGC